MKVQRTKVEVVTVEMTAEESEAIWVALNAALSVSRWQPGTRVDIEWIDSLKTTLDKIPIEISHLKSIIQRNNQ